MFLLIAPFPIWEGLSRAGEGYRKPSAGYAHLAKRTLENPGQIGIINKIKTKGKIVVSEMMRLVLQRWRHKEMEQASDCGSFSGDPSLVAWR